MTLESPTKWIQSVLVPRILKNDDFKGVAVSKTEVRAMETMKDNWASDMYEINVVLDQEGKSKTISFLLKLVSENEVVRRDMQSDKQFFNEIYFYSTAMPILASQISLPQLKSAFEALFPTCYFSYYNKEKISPSFEDAVLVMENLKLRDFTLGNRTFLDIEHYSLAFQSIGTFHAVSYFMKERDPDKFTNVIVKPILETNYATQNETIVNVLFKYSQERVIDALAKERPEGDLGVEKFRDLAARKPFDVFIDLVQPREPLAVLCHGDFLRNNVLFRYEGGKPAEMKFIDFQTIRYASPVIDLSLMLCMNSTRELRVKHFDELLKTYHTSMRETLAALLGKPTDQLDPRYSFEALLAEFRRYAVYGYMITAEFLPWMFAEGDELSEFVKVSLEERGSSKYNAMALRLGGDNATRALMILAEDLLEWQCL